MSRYDDDDDLNRAYHHEPSKCSPIWYEEHNEHRCVYCKRSFAPKGADTAALVLLIEAARNIDRGEWAATYPPLEAALEAAKDPSEVLEAMLTATRNQTVLACAGTLTTAADAMEKGGKGTAAHVLAMGLRGAAQALKPLIIEAG